MPLQIMQNMYSASSFCMTGHCYVRSVFVKHHFFKKKFLDIVAVVACLFVVAVIAVPVFIIIIIIYYYCFNSYKLGCNFLKTVINVCFFFSLISP